MVYNVNLALVFLKINGRILEANSSWSPTPAKFCQLIASLSVILSQLNLTKLKLEYLKSGFRYKNEKYKQTKSFFCETCRFIK